jgi:hypothetical protein
MEQMLVVNAGAVKTTREKLDKPDKIDEAIDDVKRMVEIKKTLLWRADAGTCCGSLCNIASSLASEISLLENALSGLEKGNRESARQILEEYEQILVSRGGSIEQKSC